MIMSSSTSLPGAVDVERLRRVELLRAELDRSLKVAAAASSLSGAAEKRSPLCILFHSADSVHIQFSGSARASVDLFARPRVGTASRFIVSPTPNAVPPAAVPPLLPPKTESSTASAWPLRVLTTTRQNDAELLENVACATAAVDKDKNESSVNSGAIILLPTPPLGAASSPASSVDSGVASPGAAGDFLLNTAPFRPSTTEQQRASHDSSVKLEQCSNSPNSVKLCRGLFNGPSWATVPRTRRWIFNFSSNKNINDDNDRSPLIDALALSSSLSSGGSTTETETVKKPTTVTEVSSSALQQQQPPPVLTLQKPPLKKKYGPNTDNSHQSSPPSQSEVSSNGYSSNLGNNFNSTLSPTESPMVAVKTESVINSEEEDIVASRRHSAVQQPSSKSSSSVVLQRQFSDGCCYNSGSDGTVLDADTEELHGLPPRAATLPPLRSILKKPRASAMMVLNSNGQQQLQQQHFLDSALPRNHLRRMPTRIVLERSVSESLLYDAVPDDQFSTLQHSAAAVFNASILRKLSMASTPVLGSFDEKLEEQHIKAEQEQQQQKQNNSGSISSSCCPSSCSSETIDSDGSGQSSAAPIAKKRVSFSEHVQARIYRSNSSILGQRRKNEKKSRNRCTRRCSSDVEHPSTTEAEVPQQQQPQQHDVVSSSNNNNISCKFYERPPLWALQSRQDFNRWRQEKEEVALWSSASSVVAGGAVPTGVASQCV
uniref:PEHE domain-containing protein n=1 Tax=Globodera pallida TaxID=36090 RepID=A0A183BUX7_GLOPA